MVGPQSRSERGGEEKNSQLPPGIEPSYPDRPARSESLVLLSYTGSNNLHSDCKYILHMYINLGCVEFIYK
jgi:hypothetical protein